MATGVFKNIAELDDVPKPCPAVDVTKLHLSAEEGFVYSRIDGKTTVRALMVLTGFADTAVAKALLRLRSLHAISLGETPAMRPKTGEDRNQPYGGMIFDLVALNEAVDLDQEQKKRILYLEAKLDEWNHFELLGLSRKATSEDVRKAYFKASREFHPDAHFRKNLGSFQRRIERIFKAMKIAYDVLSNDQMRAAYSESIVWTLSPEEEAEIVEHARRKERERQRLATQAQRRLKHNPMVERIKKARDFYQLGLAAIGSERWAEAANHLRLAVTYDPKKRDYQEAYSEANGRASRQRALAILKNVQLAYDTGQSAEVVELIEEAVRTAPEDSQVLAEAADLLLTLNDVRRAYEVAQRAVSVGGTSVTALRALARAAERAEKWNIACHAVEKLLVFEPKDAALKAWFKQLKKYM
ncbi:MAG: DnaJ domain-containing protein [Deltaproteobacteria bacterium]|nr:DnaJ domain-containing protein [Deltaproteobacteria bacterium]